MYSVYVHKPSLKYWTDFRIVHIFTEKLLGAEIWCYLWFPWVSEILSQDKTNSPNFAKFLVKRKIISNSSCLINNVHRNSEMGTQKLLHKMFLPTKNLARFGEFFFFLRQNHWHVWNPEISSNRISNMFSAWIWTIRKSVQYYNMW